MPNYCYYFEVFPQSKVSYDFLSTDSELLAADLTFNHSGFIKDRLIPAEHAYESFKNYVGNLKHDEILLCTRIDSNDLVSSIDLDIRKDWYSYRSFDSHYCLHGRIPVEFTRKYSDFKKLEVYLPSNIEYAPKCEDEFFNSFDYCEF